MNRPKLNPLVVLGITGGVASGKSTVAQFFRRRGATTISSDEIARELLAPDTETTAAVLREFGPTIAQTGDRTQIDRAKLSSLIFSNEVARARLGELMHPAIRQRTAAMISMAKSEPGCPLIAVEIPLLYENGLEQTVDFVLVTSCPETMQVERLLSRRPELTFDEALKQIRSQIPIAAKTSRADFVIDTAKSLEDVQADVNFIFDKLNARRVK